MNLNFNFENVKYEKKVGVRTLIIIVLVGFCAAAICTYLLLQHSDMSVNSAKDRAELTAALASKEFSSTLESLELVSELVKEDNISDMQVTKLLKKIINSDDKIFAAYSVLDMSKYRDASQIDFEDIESITDSSNLDENIVISNSAKVVEGKNKLIYKMKTGIYETELKRLNTLEYKKNYLKVLLTKKPQMMAPIVTEYDGDEIMTCTYSVPILKNQAIIGVIGVDIDIQLMQNKMLDCYQDNNKKFYLYSQDGVILKTNDKKNEGKNIKEVFGGKSSKGIMNFITDNLQDETLKAYKKGKNALCDELYVIAPIIFDNSNVLNIMTVQNTDKTLHNALILILIGTVTITCAFAMLIDLLWISFGKLISKKYEHIFSAITGEFEKLKLNNDRMLSSIEEIEKKEIKNEERAKLEDEIYEYDDYEDEDFDDEIKSKESDEADKELEGLLERVDFDKYNDVEDKAQDEAAAIESAAEAAKQMEFDAEKSELGESDFEVEEALEEKEAKEEEPKTEEPKIEEPKIEEPKIEEPKIEEPKIEGPKIEQPKIEEQKIEEPKIEQPKVEEPKIEQPKVEEPKIEQPKIEEPKVEETKAEDMKAADVPPERTRRRRRESTRDIDAEINAIENGEVGGSDDDYDSIRRTPPKLTGKEMDDLLKELENKRKMENEALGIEEEVTNEFSNETTVSAGAIEDLVGKINKKD